MTTPGEMHCACPFLLPRVISFTFMYDPSETDVLDAHVWSANAVWTFNRLLRETGVNWGYSEGFEVWRKNVVEAERGSFRSVGRGCCGSGCNSPIMRACGDQFNKLPAFDRGDKVHCFVSDKLWKESEFFPTVHEVGCANLAGSVGVTEHAWRNQDITVHEMGHQMGATHAHNACRNTDIFSLFGIRILEGFSCSLMTDDEYFASLWFSYQNAMNMYRHIRATAGYNPHDLRHPHFG